jgi:hypothetical protein
MTSIKKTVYVLNILIRDDKINFKKQVVSNIYIDNIKICCDIVDEQFFGQFNLYDFLMEFNNIENVLNILPKPFDNILNRIKVNSFCVFNKHKLIIETYMHNKILYISIYDAYNRGIFFTLYTKKVKIPLIN